MNLTLTKKLIEKGIIKTDTEIEAEYPAIDLSGHARATVTGCFVVTDIRDGEEPIFEVANTVNGRRRRLRAESIRAVDGMSPSRLAGIYNIRADGSLKPPGKRRGRKPKTPRPEIF